MFLGKPFTFYLDEQYVKTNKFCIALVLRVKPVHATRGWMSPQRTAWHFYLTILLRRRKPDWVDIRDEVPLSEERPRVDYLLLRKKPEIPSDDTGQTLHRLWPLIPRVAIAEYKSVSRPYRARELDRLFMYLHGYWVDAGDLKERHELIGVLLVANLTPALIGHVASMGLEFRDMQDGYWQITGGLFRMYVLEIDRIGDLEEDGVIGSFGHREGDTRQARQFWTEMVGTKEAGMGAENLEGYEEVIERFLETLPPEKRMAGLPPEKRIAGLPPEQLMAPLSPEQRMTGLSSKQRMAGLSLEQRLEDVSPEQMLLCSPVDALRLLPESYIATLPEAIREAVRKRLAR